MRSALPFALLLLGACVSKPAGPVSPPAAEGREIREESNLLEFSYSWPSEAAAIPALDRRLEAHAAAQRRNALETARQDRAARTPDAPFHGHYFHQKWSTYGSGSRLLSLAAQVSDYTGGAHGMTVYESLLWDREADAEIPLGQLFTDSFAATDLITPAYCAELDRQRSEKRGETLPLEGEGWMIQCPPFYLQKTAPADLDGDGRFDTLRILIAPYNAGPYAEGSYEVDVAVTEPIRALVKSDYAAEFQPQ